MHAKHLAVYAGSQGLPRISRAVVHGGIAYLCGVTPDPTGDVKAQTRQVLSRIDDLLAAAGIDKTRLFSAQVWLADMGGTKDVVRASKLRSSGMAH